MADVLDSAAARFRDEVRLRALARAEAPDPRVPGALRFGAIAVAVALHLGAAILLYMLMQQRPAADSDRIDVRLLDSAAAEPALPEPPPAPTKVAAPLKLVPAQQQPATRAAPATPSAPAAPSAEALSDTAKLFGANGLVRLPPPPKATPHEERLQRGRELMARGLDCTAHDADDLSHRESVGEEVARKYLSWIQLYNPAAAERRAVQEEDRQTRCRMWQEARP